MAGDPRRLKETVEQAFVDSSDEKKPFNLKQLWALVLLSKYVRLRARNNSAFNNLFNTLFPYAKFQQVTKTRISRRTGQEETYPGLQISINGETLDIDEDDGE